MQNKFLAEIWGELGRLRWGYVIFVLVCIGTSFTTGKQYGEQGKAAELIACQAQLQRQQPLLIECRNIAGDALQKTIDAEMGLKDIRK
jgi:hypothetical protein